MDNLAHRYHLLPSEALERATTFDLYVLDVSARWVKHQQDTAENKAKGLPPPSPKLTQKQMMDMIARARERNKK